MKYPKYPRYTREQKLNCKLTDKDIKNIRKDREAGFTYKHLAYKYEVCLTTVAYWITGVRYVNKYSWKKYITPEQNRKRAKTFLQRKKILQPGMNNYFKLYIKAKVINDPEYRKKRIADVAKSQKKYILKTTLRNE